ncbi:rod shape-determining protein MreC [Alteromonas sp. ASW11-130]|uniref:rod shape-determining protein MreC n=1 Tax=Alteromonas sp. ASW11-130 TaxID=3015775 RepID=UPI00224271BC|nr:rod shape-determining protein MreC [Alteromonas sp. ASW11-130]MCW8091040.1 rod shape-determining protein MreC [Alteromonas sp. ASW11-130]
MDTIFTRGPSINSRLALTLALSVMLIVIDHKFDGFNSTRVYLNSLVSPIQYLANLPSVMLSESAQRLTSHQQLRSENERLTNKLLMMSERLQRFDIIEAENSQLRKLLDAPVKPEMRKTVAELMAVDNNPFSQQILINRGAIDGVFPLQSVLDDRGIVGQVMEVGTTNSRVLLISDVTHAIPVRSVRNNIRFIASGSGSLDELILEHVPHSVDVQEGDLLLSSGLGQVFPEGYPVARVNKVVRDESLPFATVTAQPLARLDRLKYLLLIWPQAPVADDQPKEDQPTEAELIEGNKP